MTIFTSPPEKIFLFSMPRSGSTYVDAHLSHYFKRKFGHQFLSEYFNPNLRGIRYEDGELRVDTSDWHENSHVMGLGTEHIVRESLQRLAWYQEAKGPFFLKMLTIQSHPTLVRELLTTSGVIFSERQNLWEHLLSFMISFQTNQFYEKETVVWQERELLAERAQFERFLMFRARYLKLRMLRPAAPVLIFEKILADPKGYLRDQGLEGVDWDQAWLPSRQNLKPKELAFRNLETLKGWYRDSSLHREFPLHPDF